MILHAFEVAVAVEFKNKLVAVLNKSIETGKLMNALAHIIW